MQPAENPPTSQAVSLQVRKASMADIPGLLRVINGFASRGIMLPRTEFEMAENIRDFTVVCAGDQVIGCGALHFYTPHAAEIRSLAIAPESQGSGGGRLLMEALEQEANAFRVKDVFAFTYIPDFFRKSGFHEIDRGELPLKAWKDCLRCPKFQCCDEIAVIKQLSTTQEGEVDTPICGEPKNARNSPNSEIQLPVLRNWY